MKKVLFINLVTYSQTGGIENYNKNIIKSLPRGSDVVSIYDKNNENISTINFYNFNGNKLGAMFFILKNIYKYNSVISSHINLLPILIIMKILKPNLNVFLAAHGIEAWKEFNFIKRLFLNKIIIMPVSNYTKNMMIKLNNLSENNFKLLFNCIDMNIKTDFDNIYNNNNFNILSVTRLDKNDNYKGIDCMIKTIPLLIKTIPNLKYTIIGKGDDKERLEQLTKDLNVEKYIDFKGFVEYIEPYYQYCDVFTLPSKGEGFGIVYIEAMKYKKPCIACDEGGQTDVVLHNKTGFLCDYNNVECLQNSIIKLYKDNKKRELFGQNGYYHLVENFTFDKFKERLRKIIDE